MRSKKWLSPVLLLLFVLLTTAAAAQDAVRQGCRRGVMKAPSALRRAGGPALQPGGDFYHGERHQLVVLVSFSDMTFSDDDEAATLVKWDNIFNAVGYNEEPYHGSVHDYFYDQSYGQFLLTFDLHYIALDTSRTKYRSTQKDDENSQYLVQDVTEVLMTRDIDWSLYDWNGDGYVNQLLIIYPGKGMNDGGDSSSIWPHQWWLSQHMKDGQAGVYCDPIAVSYQGAEYMVDCYCALQEIGGTSNPFGTICHEYTHCFGFPDFYYSGYSILSYWDLMDHGNTSGGGYCPTAYSAHERWLMGWLTPTELTQAAVVSDMAALTDEPQAYLVRNDGWADEYYIIENRQKQGWDSSLPGAGIAIFHIDFDADIWCGASYEWVNTTSSQRYTLFHANNGSTSSGWAYPYTALGKENNQLTDDSKPAATLRHANTDGTKLMGKPIYNLAVDGDGKASFTFLTDDPTAVSSTVINDRPAEILYDLGPIYIIRYSDGTVRKVMRKP